MTTTYTLEGQYGITDLKGAPPEIWSEAEALHVQKMEPIWARWNQWYVGWCKRQGIYGKTFELHCTLQHNPVFDEPSLQLGHTQPFESYRMLFLDNDTTMSDTKALDNTSIADVKVNTSDLQVTGNGDLWQVLVKASSKQQGWMKSTKAMQTPAGCLVQTTSEFRNSIGMVTFATDSITFVPGVFIVSDANGGRRLGTKDEYTREVVL